MSAHLSRRFVLSGAALGVLIPSIGLLATSSDGPSSAAELGSGDVLTPYQFGAVGDGRSDDTAALQRAVHAAIGQRRILDLSHGTYRVTASIVGQGDIRIVNTRGAVIEAAEGRYEKFGVLVFEGRAAPVGRLSTSAAKGDTVMRLPSTAGFRQGDIGTVYDPADYSYSGFRRYYRAGEFFEVESVTDASLSLRLPLYDGYDRRGVEVYKVEPIAGYINDIAIISKGAPESLIVIDYARDFEVANALLTHANNDCIVMNRCIHSRVRNPKIKNAGDGGDDYGVVWSNSQHCRMIGGDAYARRHPVAIGGADQVNGVPCRDIVIQDAVLRNDPTTRVHCADIHGNSERCGYEGCTIFGGFSPQGKASFLWGCTVYAMSIGTAVYAAELLGGVHSIERNTFHFDSDPSKVSRGAIDFGGNSDAITSSTTGDLTIIVRDNVLISSVFGPSTMLLYARNAGTAAKINVQFADNELRVNDFSAAVRLRLDKGVAKSDFIEVDCAQTTLGNKRQVHPEAGYLDFALNGSGAPQRCRAIRESL